MKVAQGCRVKSIALGWFLRWGCHWPWTLMGIECHVFLTSPSLPHTHTLSHTLSLPVLALPQFLALPLRTHLSSFFLFSWANCNPPPCSSLSYSENNKKKNERAVTNNNRRLDSVRLLLVVAPNLPSCSPPLFAYSFCSLCLCLSFCFLAPSFFFSSTLRRKRVENTRYKTMGQKEHTEGQT